MEIKGVIFDMDGTITDSERYAKELALNIFKEKGYPIDSQFYDRLIGVNRVSGIKILSEVTKDDEISKYLLESFSIDFTKAYQNKRIGLKDGFIEILDFLKQHNIPISLATSAKMDKVIISFLSNDMEVPFKHIVTGEMVKKGKPNPEIFLQAAEKMGVDIKNCLVIEDSHNGIQGAIDAGAITIMIPDILPPLEKHLEKGVILKKDLFEVIDFIKLHANL